MTANKIKSTDNLSRDRCLSIIFTVLFHVCNNACLNPPPFLMERGVFNPLLNGLFDSPPVPLLLPVKDHYVFQAEGMNSRFQMGIHHWGLGWNRAWSLMLVHPSAQGLLDLSNTALLTVPAPTPHPIYIIYNIPVRGTGQWRWLTAICHMTPSIMWQVVSC